MKRTSNVWYWMLSVLTVCLITLLASPVLAVTTSWNEISDFRVTIGPGYTPAAPASQMSRMACDDFAQVNDPHLRQDRPRPQFGYPDGTNQLTVVNSATVPGMLGLANNASVNSRVIVDPYNVTATGTIITGGYLITGRATATVPTDAQAYGTASIDFFGQAVSPNGRVEYSPIYHTSSARSGRAEWRSRIFAKINFQDVIRYGFLFQGTVELSGDTELSWEAGNKNLSIHAPVKAGNNVHFLLDLPDGPFTQGMGKFELLIQDGILQQHSESGKLFEGVVVVDQGDGYYNAELGPINFDYDLGSFDGKQFDLTMKLLSEGQSQQAFGSINPPVPLPSALLLLGSGLLGLVGWRRFMKS